MRSESLPTDLPPYQTDVARELVGSLWRDGFVNGGALLTPEEVDVVKQFSQLQMANARHWRDRHSDFDALEYELPAFHDSDWRVLPNIAGKSQAIDIILEKALTNSTVRDVLRICIGTSYKAWAINIRDSTPNDKGLGIHQDAQGEFGISILLNDIKSPEGTTSFIRRSHRFDIDCKDSLAQKFLRPSILRHWSQPATGKAGDVFYFFKKTWHGRVKAKQASTSSAIFVSFFPVGYSYKPFKMPTWVANRLPKELNRLLNPAQGLQRNSDGSSSVIGEEKYKNLSDYLNDRNYSINTLWRYFKLPMRS